MTPAQLDPALKARTLTVNGLSKAYSMTGWRVGYGAGPKALISVMAAVQSQSATCAPSISQVAGIAALTGPQDLVRERREIFRSRRDLVVDGLNKIDGLACRSPEGAFYVFPSCAGLLGKRTGQGAPITNDDDFCQYLLREYDVAVVPGAAFGSPSHFRISYATSSDNLREALQRIQQSCAALS